VNDAIFDDMICVCSEQRYKGSFKKEHDLRGLFIPCSRDSVEVEVRRSGANRADYINRLYKIYE